MDQIRKLESIKIIELLFAWQLSYNFAQPIRMNFGFNNGQYMSDNDNDEEKSILPDRHRRPF